MGTSPAAPASASASDPAAPPPPPRKRRGRALALVLGFIALSAVFAHLLSFSAWTRTRSTTTALAPAIATMLEGREEWAQYSPYYPAGAYPPVPDGCRITQVNILQRHGARYPTTNAAAGIRAAVAKLKSAPRYTDAKLDFLKNYTYDLGENDLLPLGADESYAAGALQYARYKHLVNARNLPFVRASGSERVVQSATNWTAGFAAASNGTLRPALAVVIAEGPDSNNTLDARCPRAPSAAPHVRAWTAVYAPPVAARLNAAAPGAGVTPGDAAALLALCPLASAAARAASAVCGLFSGEEQARWAYAGDIGKYYGTGPGNALGRVQGVGYANELLARLAGRGVRDGTQTNRTLDGARATFPLGRGVYADFSHDNAMVAVYAALGLFAGAALGDGRMDAGRAWRLGRMVPFAGRMVVERLACAGAGAGGEEARVRVLVDDALQPLAFCGAGADGVCSLRAFVASQAYARSSGGGDYEKCFA